MALYGSIPYMVAHSAHSTVGLFFNNAAEMWIDIKSSKSMLGSLISLFKTGDVPTTETHWIAESGIIDMFVMLGPNPHDVSMQYSILTGTPTLPPVSNFYAKNFKSQKSILFSFSFLFLIFFSSYFSFSFLFKYCSLMLKNNYYIHYNIHYHTEISKSFWKYSQLCYV